MSELILSPSLKAALLTIQKCDERSSVAQGRVQVEACYEALEAALDVLCAVLNPRIER